MHPGMRVKVQAAAVSVQQVPPRARVFWPVLPPRHEHTVLKHGLDLDGADDRSWRATGHSIKGAPRRCTEFHQPR